MDNEPQTIDEVVKLMRRLGSHDRALSAEKQSCTLEEEDGASTPLQVDQMVESGSVDVDQLNESIKTLPQLLPLQSLRSNQSTKTFVCFTFSIQGQIARNCPRVLSEESKRRKKL